MSPDLKTLMKRSAPEPSRKFDAEVAAKRSRSLQWRGRLVTASATVLLAAAVFFFFAATDPGSGKNDDKRSQVVNPGPEKTESEVPLKDQAASFAIQALADADLHNPAGTYFDYQSIHRLTLPSDVEQFIWKVEFSGPECEFNRPCELLGVLKPATLHIELRDEEFAVTKATGLLDRDGVEGFSGPINQGRPRFVWTLVHDKARSNEELAHVAGSYFWTGPIPGNYYGECEAQSGEWDEGENSIRLPMDSPSTEGERDGFIDIATESQVDPGPIDVRCDPVRNLAEDDYEMPPVPDDLELVQVGPEVIVPEQPELAPDKDEKQAHGLPTGPRVIIAQGSFDEGAWGQYQGQDWWFLVWAGQGQIRDDDESAARYICDEFVIGGLDDKGGGWGCLEDTPNPDLSAEPNWFQDTTFDPGAGEVLSRAHGYVDPGVTTVEFELTSGQLVRVETFAPPDELDVGFRYFVAFMPAAENGYMVARSSDGEELDRRRLCSQSCIGDSNADNNVIYQR